MVTREAVVFQDYGKQKSLLRKRTEKIVIWTFLFVVFFAIWFFVFYVFAADSYVKFRMPIPWLFLFMGGLLLAIDQWLLVFITRVIFTRRKGIVLKRREEIEKKEEEDNQDDASFCSARMGPCIQ